MVVVVVVRGTWEDVARKTHFDALETARVVIAEMLQNGPARYSKRTQTCGHTHTPTHTLILLKLKNVNINININIP